MLRPGERARGKGARQRIARALACDAHLGSGPYRNWKFTMILRYTLIGRPFRVAG